MRAQKIVIRKPSSIPRGGLSIDKEGFFESVTEDKEGFLLVNIGGLPMGFLQSLH